MVKLRNILLLLLLSVLVVACATTDETQNTEEYEVLNEGESVVVEEINVADRVFFGLDQYKLDKSAKNVLDSQVAYLNQESDVKVTIAGHCDERGTREYNLALGERRASAVKNYLVSKGVSKARVKTLSYGKEKPIVLGSGEEVWAQNRVAVTEISK